MSKMIVNSQNKAMAVNGNALVVEDVVTIDPTRIYAWISTTGAWTAANDSYSIAVPVIVGARYRLSLSSQSSGVVGSIFRWGFDNSTTPQGRILTDWVRTTPQSTATATVTASKNYLIIQLAATYARSMLTNNILTIRRIYG